MIRPICCANSLTFRGEVQEGEFIKKAFKFFSPEELNEYNTLKEKAQKVDDGRLFGMYKSHRYEQNGDIFHYVGLDEHKAGKIETLSKETYMFESMRKNFFDRKAFARAVLKPLRKIYG